MFGYLIVAFLIAACIVGAAHIVIGGGVWAARFVLREVRR